MPLPEPNTPWPPPAWQDVFTSYRQWDAWYSGDPQRLAEVYGAGGADLSPRPSQFSGGLVGKLSRFFWGTPQRQVRSTKLHVPAAADIASTSADLLFSEPPALNIAEPDRDTVTQERLDELFNEETTVALIEAAEVASALSGVFLRATWDRAITDRPMPTVVHPDAAIPTFRWGRLVEVTFYRVVREDDGKLWRHCEHHAPGVVQHGLYMGDRENLGRPVPLADDPATEPLATEVSNNDGVSIPTGLDGLDTVYVPNAKPNRRWRNHGHAAHLGRSDLDGVEHMMDALDETYTSWMRDIRIGKGRVIVPDSYLETGGRGQGATFDMDRDVYSGLNMLGSKDNPTLTVSQFAIRVDEHAKTANEWWQKIVDGAGYSAQTFGLAGEVEMTATEFEARNRKTNRTRAGKIRLWRMGLSRMAEILLTLDQVQFGTPVTPQPVNVDFAPAITESRDERAQTAKLLNDAEAASTETKVRLVHPDWDDEQVRNEVDAIESSTAPPDSPPMTLAG